MPRYTTKLRSRNGNTYRALVVLPNKKVFGFGSYLTEEEAHQAAMKAKREVEEGVFDMESKRVDRRIQVGGRALYIYQWAEILGVHQSVIPRRAKRVGRTVAEEIEDRLLQLNSDDPED